MAKNEWKEPNNEENYKKQGYGPVKGVAMMIESAERDTYMVEVANNAERKAEVMEVKSTDIMEGKITTIVAHDDSIQESKARKSKGEEKDF